MQLHSADITSITRARVARCRFALAVATASLFTSVTAAASPGEAAAPNDPTLSAPASLETKPKSSAEFSAGRMVGEVLVGFLAGGLAGYATYSGLCTTDSDCVGAALAGAGANWAVGVTSVYATGRLFGGRGSFTWTLVGGLLPFSATAPLAQDRPGLALGLGVLLAPLGGAALFEINSHVTSRKVSVAPLVGSMNVEGKRVSVVGLQGAF